MLPVRRTRKRFTNVQLTMLENLFHQNSHPSRDDREALARAGGMEIKSVTIWFQNKRQTERKSAASTTGHAPALHPTITSTIHTFALDPLPQPRPSLDRVASRSELRTPNHPRPHSPRRLSLLYDHLPSSPLHPPTSPPTRDFLDFATSSKTRRTLEWACEAARIADRDKDRVRDHDWPCCSSPLISGHHRHHPHQTHQLPSTSRTYSRRPSSSLTLRGEDQGDITDSELEVHEAITPPSPSPWSARLTKTSTNTSLTSSSSSASISREGSTTSTNTSFTSVSSVEDDAMFKAAIALCGLGRVQIQDSIQRRA